MIARDIADDVRAQVEQDRARQARQGHLRRIGSHPDGSPKYGLTWSGRKAVFLDYLDRAEDAFCHWFPSAWERHVLTASVTMLLTLAAIFVVRAIGRAHGAPI